MVDNICSALCRMVMTNAVAVPMDQVTMVILLMVIIIIIILIKIIIIIIIIIITKMTLFTRVTRDS